MVEISYRQLWNGKYLASIMDDSGMTCDEVIESYDEDVKAKLNDEKKLFQQVLMKKKKIVKHKVSKLNFHFY